MEKALKAIYNKDKIPYDNNEFPRYCVIFDLENRKVCLAFLSTPCISSITNSYTIYDDCSHCGCVTDGDTSERSDSYGSPSGNSIKGDCTIAIAELLHQSDKHTSTFTDAPYTTPGGRSLTMPIETHIFLFHRVKGNDGKYSFVPKDGL
uniref:Uncharacterized protein n=1 Tax=Marseillevirus LCMAC101 TaxID=2506602 RepID=A0A481YSC0_9VIRU|nr:MAG: hypothetical protein LCMAC101_05440 [Marseillevirus LCMAC101]